MLIRGISPLDGIQGLESNYHVRSRLFSYAHLCSWGGVGKVDIRKYVVIDLFEYPIDRLSCRENLLLRMHRAILSVNQLLYSGHQLCL